MERNISSSALYLSISLSVLSPIETLTVEILGFARDLQWCKRHEHYKDHEAREGGGAGG